MVKNASVHIETFILPWLCTSFTKHVTLLYPGFILFSLNMSLCVFRTFFLMWWKFALCGQGFNSVIAPKYGNVEWIFGITDDMAKPLHRYLSDHPCWVAFTGPTLAGVPIINAKNCMRIDNTCVVTISDYSPHLTLVTAYRKQYWMTSYKARAM